MLIYYLFTNFSHKNKHKKQILITKIQSKQSQTHRHKKPNTNFNVTTKGAQFIFPAKMNRGPNRGARGCYRYNPYQQRQTDWGLNKVQGSFTIPKQSPKSAAEQLKELEEKRQKLLKEVAIENNAGKRIKEVNAFLKTNPDTKEMRNFLINLSTTIKKEVQSLPANHWSRFHISFPDTGTTTFEPCLKFNLGQCHTNDAAHIMDSTRLTILHHSCWICYKVCNICIHEKVSNCMLLKWLDKKEKEKKSQQTKKAETVTSDHSQESLNEPQNDTSTTNTTATLPSVTWTMNKLDTENLNTETVEATMGALILDTNPLLSSTAPTTTEDETFNYEDSQTTF